MRPVNELFPKALMDELLRLARKNRDWVQWVDLGNGCYEVRVVEETWTRRLYRGGADVFGMWGLSVWLVDGPKTFMPSTAHCEEMEQIEVRLSLADYAQPYPALMVELPLGRYAPFERVLCHRSKQILTCQLTSADHIHDVVTTIAVDGRAIEASIRQFDDDCAEHAQTAGMALRVALNSCLCLVNFGCRRAPLRLLEVERDRRLAGEQSERGQRARDRLRLAMSVLSFAQEVKLHDNIRRRHLGVEEPTGREMSTHWRRGHWAMVACGKGRAERRRALRKPCLVRGDRLAGDVADTSVVYR